MNTRSCSCLFSISEIKYDPCSENGDVMGFVLDAASKTVIVRSGESRALLQLSLIDQGSLHSPIIYQLWDGNIRKYHHLAQSGCFVVITGFTRVRSRDNDIALRGGEVQTFYGTDIASLQVSCQFSQLFPVEQHSILSLIDWIAKSPVAKFLRPPPPIKSKLVYCLSAARTEYCVDLNIFVDLPNIRSQLPVSSLPSDSAIQDSNALLIEVKCVGDKRTPHELQSVKLSISELQLNRLIGTIVACSCGSHNTSESVVLAQRVSISSVYKKRVTMLQATNETRFSIVCHKSDKFLVKQSVVEESLAQAPIPLPLSQNLPLVDENQFEPVSWNVLAQLLTGDERLYADWQGKAISLVGTITQSSFAHIHSIHELSSLLTISFASNVSAEVSQDAAISIAYCPQELRIRPSLPDLDSLDASCREILGGGLPCIVLPAGMKQLCAGLPADLVAATLPSPSVLAHEGENWAGELLQLLESVGKACDGSEAHCKETETLYNFLIRVCATIDENDMLMSEYVLSLEALIPYHVST